MDWRHRFEQVDSNFEKFATICLFVREGSWYWAHSLEPMDYSDWSARQPDDVGDENCALIFGKPGHLWNDYHCSDASYPEQGSVFSICQRSL